MKRRALWTLLGLGAVVLVSIGLRLLPNPKRQGRFSSIPTEKAVAFTFGKLVRNSRPGEGEIVCVQLTDGDARQGNAFTWVVPRVDFIGVPPRDGPPEEIFNAQYELRLAKR